MLILLVEDDPDNREMMKVILETEGHAVHGYPTAAEALGACLDAGPRFDLALVDINLPGMDGLELVRRLRAVPRTQDLAVLCVSGSARQGEAQVARLAGADHYLTKPFRRRDLLAAIDRAIRGRPG